MKPEQVPDAAGTVPGWRAAARASCCLVALVLGAALWSDAVLGCPNCKDAVDTTDPDGLNLARGYFYSILLMLAMPFTLAGSFGCYVWREVRRQRREQSRSGDVGAGCSSPGSTVEPHP